MKTDLFTSIVIFVIGTVVAFVTATMIIPGIEDFDIKTVNVNTNTSLTEPDDEVFNYRAINPTVEVYVGDGNSEVSAPENNGVSNESDTTEDRNENIVMNGEAGNNGNASGGNSGASNDNSGNASVENDVGVQQ